MNANEFVSKYILHDSLIEAMSIRDDKTIIMTIDFAFWM